MPYQTIADLPPAVRDRYSERCQRVFMEAYNQAAENTDEEATRFRIAHAAAGNCQSTKAEWDAEYINDLPDSAFACPEQRKYPHHRADGTLDLPHLRNALSRVRQENTEICGVRHLQAHADAEGVGKSKEMPMTTAVKFVKGSELSIEGLAIPYGGPFGGKDLEGEFFTKNTDFCLDWFPVRPTIYDHGLDDALKTSVVGQVTKHDPIDDGIWAKAQLDKNHRYLNAIQELIDKGALGFSSGAMSHLVDVDKKTGEIKKWPWVELSLTPIPANPDALVYAVKSATAVAHWAALGDGSGSESFDDHAARVVREVEDYAGRVRKRLETRVGKIGRELSTTNRQWLQSLDERLASLIDLRAEIKEALHRTDPEAEKAARAAYLRFLELQAAELGVPLQEN